MGLTYIKEEHRTRGVLYETVLCEQHLAAKPPGLTRPCAWNARGLRRLVQPYTGAATCLECDLAPELENAPSPTPASIPSPETTNLAVGVERIPIDSSTIRAVGYAARVLVIEFHTGAIYAYPAFPPAEFEAFARASSKGQYFNQWIRGKQPGQKCTGQCPACGSTPELIGQICTDCGTAVVRAVEMRKAPGPEGEEGHVEAELTRMQEVSRGRG